MMKSRYDTRSDVRTVRKFCVKCRQHGWYKPRERHCKRPHVTAMGRSGWACWGALTVPQRRPRPADLRLPAGLGIGAVLDEEVQQQMQHEAGERVRADARKKLEAARRKVIEWTLKADRALTLVRKWQRAVQRQEQRAAMSDAQVQAEAAYRKARSQARPRRRAVSVGGLT